MAELIAAVATGSVRSAVGILRLSGTGAIQAAESVFMAADGRVLSDHAPQKLVYGTLLDSEGNAIDQILATFSRAPHSYTGEETAELQCHGAPVVLTMGLEALFAAGARQARAGEFTKRAFLNGKLDLTQSEAVIDLIDAQTAAAARNAYGQLNRGLSEKIEVIYSELVDVMAHFHAVLDYPDEDIDPFQAATIAETLDKTQQRVALLMATYQRGRHLVDGVPCAIVGRPNGGKSSLLNALLGYDRAIVTDVAGTTRDTVEERCTVGGVLLRLIDTAGLRETEDTIEQMGVERSRSALTQAELALLVIDGSVPLTAEDGVAIAAAQGASQCICVVNKSDLPCQVDVTALTATFSHCCTVSATTGEGLTKLEGLVAQLFPTGHTGGDTLLTNARQFSAASQSKESLQRARESLLAGYPPDVVLMDIESALIALGELTGRTVREDITGRIFQRFCVGK